jgi:glutamyl-tRNA synthetase
MSHPHLKTRLAPSPTGALHLGNARTFLINYLLARKNNWSTLLRIEDLDGPRIKKGADHQAIDDLRWLGLSWDEGPIYQSSRLPLYQEAIKRLIQTGHAYPCICSRSEVAFAASAPHAEDGAAIYPGTCRGRFSSIDEARAAAGREPALRFVVPDEAIEFHDQFAGPKRFNPARDLGDFVIAKSDGTPAYQLAVVVDDADMNITRVVRGDDLLDSTPRQILLYRALGLSHLIPAYCHLPLVIGPDARRLAKRHGDSRLAHYRSLGVTPGRILALLAQTLGLQTSSDSLTINDLLDRFDLQQVPHDPFVFTQAHDEFLRSP